MERAYIGHRWVGASALRPRSTNRVSNNHRAPEPHAITLLPHNGIHNSQVTTEDFYILDFRLVF